MGAQTIPSRGNPQALVRWLLAVALLIVTIVAVGGITRLTESGLSITEWKPVTGTLPPLSEAQWQAEFEAYKQIPQYTELNGPAGMTLDDYKFIYFWEWFHRLLGRVIGLALVGGIVWFALRRQIPQGYFWRLTALAALVGLQGSLGWWMVASGVEVDSDVKVSHLRLAAHLLVALVTLGGVVWTMLDLMGHRKGRPPARLTGLSASVLVVLVLQLIVGAFVAGLRAGYVASDWPLMQGSFFPEGVDWSRGVFFALTHDPYLVHFVHRWWAWVVVAVLIVLARRIRAISRPASVAIHSAFGVQILLGIATVMTGVSLWIAVLHQLVGALLVWAVVWGAHIDGRAQRRGAG